MSDNMYKRLLDRSIACNEELVVKLSKSEALLDKAINAMEKTACDNDCCECDDDQKGVAPWCGFITRTVLTEITKERSDEKGDKP